MVTRVAAARWSDERISAEPTYTRTSGDLPVSTNMVASDGPHRYVSVSVSASLASSPSGPRTSTPWPISRPPAIHHESAMGRRLCGVRCATSAGTCARGSPLLASAP